ncbi:Flagellar hook-length control protein FliK [Sphingomonas laterariae]|uniref:Flagellar hook-length control protein FliK n=1 Tax=Edaphosphingomonas laterariae TaxID=861865 RepID=A0A239HW04_9SPHN|nr:flagellar hook-length control protein FliK [Sphingomonas laterariae]SNS84873.1 Flagellar hook-length control protein FliK [Sphingomonas laterariae]
MIGHAATSLGSLLAGLRLSIPGGKTGAAEAAAGFDAAVAGLGGLVPSASDGGPVAGLVTDAPATAEATSAATIGATVAADDMAAPTLGDILGAAGLTLVDGEPTAPAAAGQPASLPIAAPPGGKPAAPPTILPVGDGLPLVAMPERLRPVILTPADFDQPAPAEGEGDDAGDGDPIEIVDAPVEDATQRDSAMAAAIIPAAIVVPPPPVQAAGGPAVPSTEAEADEASVRSAGPQPAVSPVPAQAGGTAPIIAADRSAMAAAAPADMPTAPATPASADPTAPRLFAPADVPARSVSRGPQEAIAPLYTRPVVESAARPAQMPVAAPATATMVASDSVIEAPRGDVSAASDAVAPELADAGTAPVAPTAPTATPVPLAAPSATAALPDAAAPSAPANTVDIGQVVIGHQLDLARDSAWLDQLARDITAAAAIDSRLQFKLNPEHLGSLHVELMRGDDGASVRLTTENEAARAILADAQGRLVAEARAHGMKISETHVDLGQQGGQGQGQGQGQRGWADGQPGQPHPQSQNAYVNASVTMNAVDADQSERRGNPRERYA